MTKRPFNSDTSETTDPGPSIFRIDDLDLTDRPRTSKNDNDEQAHFRGKKFKNSLDSDEDDDEIEATKYNMLDPDELEGQEEETIQRDGEIQITPFNMREELQEGYFDKEGSFIFRKDPDEIKDSWLDNIDWVKIKERPNLKEETAEESDSDEDEFDPTETYKAMLEIMQPKETVQKALQRLGGKSTSAGNRWKKKSQDEPTEAEKINKERLIYLTSLADKLVSSGNMEIYQQTHERLSFLVTAKLNPPPKFDSSSVDVAADMFGDDFDVEKVASNDAQRVSETGDIAEKSEEKTDSEVKWEFKWENKNDAEVYGPHPTSEILRWIEEGYFKEGVWVRKVGEVNAPFYSSNRVDFELYV